MKTLRMMSGEVETLRGMDEDDRFTTAPARIANREALEDVAVLRVSLPSRGMSGKACC